MAAIPRAREFVLRDKRRSVQRQVDDICGAYWDTDDDAVIVPQVRARLEETFCLTIHLSDEQFRELLSSSPAEPIATLVAKKLLDRDPPDTKPAWTAPWLPGFPEVAIEQRQANASSSGRIIDGSAPHDNAAPPSSSSQT